MRVHARDPYQVKIVVGTAGPLGSNWEPDVTQEEDGVVGTIRITDRRLARQFLQDAMVVARALPSQITVIGDLSLN
jgi:hypothetical protein